MKQELIDLYTELHSKDAHYGRTATYSRMIYGLCVDHGCKTLLDYGCGKGMLANVISNLSNQEIAAYKYDPAIPEFSKLPSGMFDMVVANDVLEHLSPDDYKQDIDKIVSLSSKVLFFNISCRPAVFKLPDGRNCHTLVHSPMWWTEFFFQYENFSTILHDYRPKNKNLVLALKRNE